MRWLSLLALALPLTAGCGSKMYTVEGTVAYEDGTPYTDGGLIVFEKTEGDKTVMARGEIQADGRFALATAKPGDGVPPGTYRVLVAPIGDLMPRANPGSGLTFDKKYSQYDTSGLSIEVKPESNKIPIKIGLPVKKASPDPRL